MPLPATVVMILPGVTLWIRPPLTMNRLPAPSRVLSSNCALVADPPSPAQVRLGSEYGIDNIGSYWFCCNASKRIWTEMPTLDVSRSSVVLR